MKIVAAGDIAPYDSGGNLLRAARDAARKSAPSRDRAAGRGSRSVQNPAPAVCVVQIARSGSRGMPAGPGPRTRTTALLATAEGPGTRSFVRPMTPGPFVLQLASSPSPWSTLGMQL
jgi:hypothetical protein